MQLSYELYGVIQSKIALCDSRIEQLLTERMQQTAVIKDITVVKKKKIKNAPRWTSDRSLFNSVVE